MAAAYLSPSGGRAKQGEIESVAFVSAALLVIACVICVAALRSRRRRSSVATFNRVPPDTTRRASKGASSRKRSKSKKLAETSVDELVDLVQMESNGIGQGKTQDQEDQEAQLHSAKVWPKHGPERGNKQGSKPSNQPSPHQPRGACKAKSLQALGL